VAFNVDQFAAVSGQAVADLTHMLAELVENAVRFSPPDTGVSVRTRPRVQETGGWVLTVEDWGVGMPAEDLASANELLAAPKEVDLSVSQRLGLHVIARLAQRHGVSVSLSPTPGGGITAVVVLPAELFSETVAEPVAAAHRTAAARVPSLVGAGAAMTPQVATGIGHDDDTVWQGWWESPAPQGAASDRAAAHVTDLGATDLASAGFGAADLGMLSRPAARMPAAGEPVGDTPVGQPRPLRSATPAPGRGFAPQPPDVTELPADQAPEPPVAPQLTRRVPQAHLAPELRVPGDADPIEVTPPSERLPNAAEAKAALARYQASRRAARAVVEDRSADGGERV
jgi:hypothetical protein